MRKRPFLAAAGVTAALIAGGATAIVLGTPGVSGAQTGSTPTTVAPNTGGGGTSGGSGTTDPQHHCTNMGGSSGTTPGTAPATGSATNTATQLGFHHFRGGGFQ